MRKIVFIILTLLFTAGTSSAQTSGENWTLLVQKGGNRISIDLKSADFSKEDDITVWALEEHNSPIVIESVPNKIYKTKTHYLINKNLKRYGIIQLMYYDEKGNVLKHFSYINDSQEKDYKYSYPILPESAIEKILDRCLESIKK
jgi:hypothetical protein